MLPREHRLNRAEEFRRVSRSRARSRGPLLSVTARATSGTGRVGFVVPRPVGTAVARNRVRRRLRHLVQTRLDVLVGFEVVVRVNPPAAAASHDQLVVALDRGLTASVAQAARRVSLAGATS